MQRLFSMFPGATAGLALLLLRFSVATIMATTPAFGGDGTRLMWWRITSYILAAAILFGCFTPIAAGAGLVARAFASFTGRGDEPIQALIYLFTIMALTLLGPGAYSFDAQWFGRRIIKPR